MYFDNHKRRVDKRKKAVADHEKMVNASGVKFAWWPVTVGYNNIVWLENVRWKNRKTGCYIGERGTVSYFTEYFRLESR